MQQDIYENLLAVPCYWRLVNWHERSAAAFGIEVRHPSWTGDSSSMFLAIPGKQLFTARRVQEPFTAVDDWILPEKIRSGKKDPIRCLSGFRVREGAASELQENLQAPLSADLGFLEEKRLKTIIFVF